MDKELKRNLKLSPQERIEEHQKALSLVLELEKTKKAKLNGSSGAKPQSAS